MSASKNYVLGRGKLFFDMFEPGTQVKTGERYLGNTPALAMNSAYSNLDHFDADEGLRVKDDQVQLQVDRSGTFSCDHISMANVGLMFGAEDGSETVTSASGLSETFVVKLGRYYQLGSSVDVPDGVGNVSNVVVTDNTGLHAFGLVTFAANPSPADTITVNGHVITFVSGAPGTHEVQIGSTTVITAQRFLDEINAYPALYDVGASGVENAITLRAIASGTGGNSIALAKSGTNPTISGATLAGGSASGVIDSTGNFEVDLVSGRIHILDVTADLGDGDTIEVSYDLGVSTRPTVIDGSIQAEGAFRFISANARGTNKDYYWPRAKVTPNGAYDLKGEAWQTMSFNFEVLEPLDGSKRVYIRERPAA